MCTVWSHVHDRLPLMPRRLGLALAAAVLFNCAAPNPAAADDAVRVVASIKPVHSLVSAVMAGVGEPHLLMRGAASPHTFTMRPSDASVLENAHVIFLIGEAMETSLARPIDTLAGNARVIALSEAQGLVRRSLREGGTFEAHDHGTDDDHGHHAGEGHEGEGHEDEGHGHEGHGDDRHGDEGHGHEGHEDERHGHEGHEDEGHGDEGHGDEGHGHEGHGDEGHGDEGHGHEGHEDEGHGDEGHGDEGHGHEGHEDEGHGDEGHGDEGHGHEGHEDEGHGDEGHGHEGHEDEGHEDEGHGHDDHDHESGAFDQHIWLDPVNGGVMVRAIADALSEADPANAETYTANARALLGRLEEFTTQLAAEVAPLRGKPFIVFHDAYRYFEDRFGLTAAGSSVVSPGRSPGVRRIAELRKIRELGVTCVFTEPQFEPRIVNVIIEGTTARTGILDPLGADIESGPEMYFTLLRDLAASFRACLAPAGQD